MKKFIIVNCPGSAKNAPSVFLDNLIDILLELSVEVSVIAGRAQYLAQEKRERPITIHCIENRCCTSSLSRVLNYFRVQLRISVTLFELRKNVDSVIFFIGGDTLLLPMVAARVLGKRTSILVAGSSIKTLESKRDPLQHGLWLLRFVTCTLVDKILVYSGRLIGDYSLDRWAEKIDIAPRHFVDFNKFTVSEG